MSRRETRLPSKVWRADSAPCPLPPGGLYAELLQNRALQIVDVNNQTTALYAWSALNGSTLAAVNETVTAPVSAALPNSFQVDLSGGHASFENEGYWGASPSSPFRHTHC